MEGIRMEGMNEKNIRKFLGKEVAIGVPHYTEDRPFYYYGRIIEMNTATLIIEMSNGFKLIKYKDIIDIRED